MDARLHALILQILNECKDLTLATVGSDGVPQASIVNFAHDQLTLYFATARDSRKVRNISAQRRVAAALRPEYADWASVKGLSIEALAEVLADDGSAARQAKEYLDRRFCYAEETPTPQDPATTAYVRLRPLRIWVSDYSRGYGHRELLDLGGAG